MRANELFIATALVATVVSPSVHADPATDLDCTRCVNGVEVANNAITSIKIRNGAVKSADLGTGVVTEAKLAPSVMETINTLAADVAALKAENTSLKADVVALKKANASLATRATRLEKANVALKATVAAQQEVLSYFSVTALDDPSTGSAYPTVQLSGANLQIVNGLGATDTKNGTGNLIVGYNAETGDFHCSVPLYPDETACTDNGAVWSNAHRSGSHNIVAGEANNYSSVGGLVTGWSNTVNGVYASVSAGLHNAANGEYSSVSGGMFNTARANFGSVSGGRGNYVGGLYGSILGGSDNTASGFYSSVSGGRSNLAQGSHGSLSGGQDNVAGGDQSTVSGGRGNTASNHYSNVSGGFGNTASAYYSSVSGGLNRSATGTSDWRAGSLFEDQ